MEDENIEKLNKKLVSTSNIRDLVNKGIIEWPSVEEFSSFQIVIATLTGSSRLGRSNLDKGHFDYIFLDECAAATEPESLIPIIGLGIKTKNDFEGLDRGQNKIQITSNLVLLGDHKQLSAVINSNISAMMGLGVSLMERIMTKRRYKPNPKYNSKYVIQLIDNYRSHPALLQFSNSMFYGKMLRAKVPDELGNFAKNFHALPNQNFPILFHSVKTSSQIKHDTKSSFNYGEIKKVQFYVKLLLEQGIDGKKVEKQDIGIISPYRAQLEALRKVLSKGIEIGTAEYYQGREKKIIIISTVKSNTGIGFLKNEKRLNVVLTRAQSLLIIVGNPSTLQQDSMWKAFIHFCYQNNAFVGLKNKLKSMTIEDKKKVDEMTVTLRSLKVD